MKACEVQESQLLEPPNTQVQFGEAARTARRDFPFMVTGKPGVLTWQRRFLRKKEGSFGLDPSFYCLWGDKGSPCTLSQSVGYGLSPPWL